jgi:hypothetical protein
MAGKRPPLPLILTANELFGGDVVYFTRNGWSTDRGRAFVATRRGGRRGARSVLEEAVAEGAVVDPADRGPVQAAAADERPLSAAARLHAAHRHPLWHAVLEQLRKLAHDRRPTTAATATSPPAQNIQFNWIKLATLPDILERSRRRRDALPSRPPAIASATSPPTLCRRRRRRDRRSAVWAELIRQWSTLHPEFSSCRASSRSR